MDKLNPPQKAAVKHTESPLLVLAGAGSGKTRVITQKIAYLIREIGMEPRHIAAVTFTNKAAKEMKERVGKLMEKGEARGLQVNTFHTLGLNILKREHEALGYKKGFSIFDAQDAATVLRELTRRGDDVDKDEIDKVRHQISRWKNDFINPQQAFMQAEDEFEQLCARIYENYQRQLKAYNAMDFDDLIVLPVQLFEAHGDILQKWRGRIRYLLVDEYQDTNATQYRLVKQLVGGHLGLTVVGDDDQSIYSWRGARPENLALLQKDFPTLRVIKLEQNYRSCGVILKAANQLIANNPHVFDKKLWSDLGFGDPIRIIECATEEDEGQRLAAEIIQHKFRTRSDFGDYAILYRGNFQSRVFEQALRAHNIPYKVTGGTSFFERAEVKDMLAYIRLLANMDDDAAFLRIINTPKRDIGPTTLEKLGNYALSRGISLMTACFEYGLVEQLSESAHARIMRFAEWLVRMNEQAKRSDPLEAIKDTLKQSHYEDWLYDTLDPKAAEKRMANIWELIDWISRMIENNDEMTIADISSQLTLRGILDNSEEADTWDAVNLLTLHASKGLEFPHVFLVGMEEELLPHRTSIMENTIEEERRLTYVGITRAQRTLTITMARKRRRYGEDVETEASRFLEELPSEDLQWEGKNRNVDPEVKKARGLDQLANIKAMLGG